MRLSRSRFRLNLSCQCRSISHRNSDPAPRTAVPEAAVDEDADAPAGPNNVGASGPLQTQVKPVASEAVFLEKGAQPPLRCGVPPPDSRHRVPTGGIGTRFDGSYRPGAHMPWTVRPWTGELQLSNLDRRGSWTTSLRQWVGKSVNSEKTTVCRKRSLPQRPDLTEPTTARLSAETEPVRP